LIKKFSLGRHYFGRYKVAIFILTDAERWHISNVKLRSFLTRGTNAEKTSSVEIQCKGFNDVVRRPIQPVQTAATCIGLRVLLREHDDEKWGGLG